MKSKKRNSLCFSLFVVLLSPLACFAEINTIKGFSYGDQELLNSSRESSKGLPKTLNKCQLAQIIKSRPKSADLKSSLQHCIDLLSSTVNGAVSSKQWKDLANISKQLIELKKYQQKTTAYSGGISGVGIQIDLDQHSNLITITQVVPGAPAALAGLKVNDAIVSINGKAIIITSNTDLKEIIYQVRGADGTSVDIRLRRGRKEWSQRLVRRLINTNANSGEVYLREYVGLYKAYYMQEDLAGAKKTYPTLFNILRAKHGDSSEEIASLMVDHASFLFYRGEQNKAYTLLKSAITIYEKNPEVNKQDLMLLYSKASFYLNSLNRTMLAMSFQDNALAIFRKHPELQSSNNARQLVANIGFTAQSCTNNYHDNSRCYEYGVSSYEIASQFLAESDLAYQLALFYYAESVFTYRTLPEAMVFYKKVLSLKEAYHSNDPKSILITINNIASKFAASGNYFEAEQYFVKASKVALDSFGQKSEQYIMAHDQLINFYSYAGLYASMNAVIDDLYKQALLLRGNDEDSDQFRLAAYKFKLFSLNRSNKSTARDIVDKTSLLIRKYPSDPIAKLVGLQVKAYDSLVLQSDLNKTKQYYLGMLRLINEELTTRKDSLDTERLKFLTLDTLSMIEAASGDYSKAIESASALLKLTRSKGRLMESLIPYRLQKLAQYQIGLGRYNYARKLLDNGIEEAHKINSYSDLFSFLYLAQGHLSALQGNAADAVKYFDKFTISYIDGVYSSLWRTPSYLRTQLSSPYPEEVESIFQYHANSNHYNQAALFTRLNFKGIIADIELIQNKLISVDNKTTEIKKKLQFAYKRASAVGISETERGRSMLIISELENTLFELMPFLKFKPTQVNEVASNLPANSILVEFQKYGRFPRQDRIYFANQKKYQYAAFVLSSSGAIRRFDLGPAEIIDTAIARASHASSEGLSDADKQWVNVSKLILAPLNEVIIPNGEIFISPDSELNRVPFTALPSPFSSGFLVDTVRLRILTSGRDLLALSKQLDHQSKSSVVIANPSFDVAETKIERAQNSLPLTRSSSIDPIRNGIRWVHLPATEKEGSAIASLIHAKLVHSAQATPLFVQTSLGPKILHIASHGYFFGDQQDNASMPVLNSFGVGYGLGVSSNSGQGLSRNQKNPLLKSGIVLAGANQPTTNPDDDGYLTALEVSRLQLNGTELFVVSACASGQGDVQTGEGVYGLSRAIAVAGARSSLLSLWKVDDAATAEFMIRFYKRLKAGEGRSDALAAVQKEFRAGSVGDGKWKEPYYWAAWQLVGDWRPIPGL